MNAQERLASAWWIPLVRGILAIVFGILALVYPELTLTALIYIFAVYAILDGAMRMWEALSSRDYERDWGWGLLEGLIGIAAGAAAALVPRLAGLTLLIVIAIWAIISGGLELFAAVRLRKRIANEFWLGLAGLASLLFGILILFDPLGGAIATAWLIGIYAIAFGVFFVALALRLRGLDGGHGDGSTGSDALRGTT